jgi:hypothetical protein
VLPPRVSTLNIMFNHVSFYTTFFFVLKMHVGSTMWSGVFGHTVTHTRDPRRLQMHVTSGRVALDLIRVMDSPFL